MFRFVLLSISCLLLLTACGDGPTGQAGREEPVTDTSSKDLNKVFEDTTGARVTDTKSADDGKTRQKTEDIPKLDTGPIKSKSKGGSITREVGKDVAQFLKQPSPKSCRQCDLSEADLMGTDLTGANLAGANLGESNFLDAKLGDVIGADFSDAKNVPPKYLKD